MRYEIKQGSQTTYRDAETELEAADQQAQSWDTSARAHYEGRGRYSIFCSGKLYRFAPSFSISEQVRS